MKLLMLRTMEMCCAIVALGFHIAAILDPTKPMEHVMHLCGTFFGFFLLSLFLNVGTCLNLKIPMFYEAVISSCGFVLFMFAAFSTMYLAGQDNDLKFLMKEEEAALQGYFYCEGQFACIICMGLHMIAFLYSKEPYDHVVIFCGTYFGFAVIEILLNVGYFMAIVMPLFLEAIIASTGFILFILTSILAEYYNERDIHLEYLSDSEETEHRFFINSKKQSIASLVAGSIYLLHSIYAIDYLISYNSETNRRLTSIYNNPDDDEINMPIQLHVFCRPLLRLSSCCNYCEPPNEDEEN